MNSKEEEDQLSQCLKEKARAEGFNPVGIARVTGSSRIQLRNASLERWLEAGNQGDMKWMQDPKRKNIESLLEGVSSVLAVGLNYYIDQKPKNNALLIGRYAWGQDYHKVIEKRLKKVGRWLESKKKNCKWRVCVDSTALLEKAWAEEAGIGWIGKHSNLINSNEGSWMVLGFLLCTEPLTADKPSKPLCGICRKCIDHCPTQAITEPFVIDSNKCIPYHTIENRQPVLPENISKSMGRWIAGCDICQEICPWNQKNLTSSEDADMQPKEWVINLTKDQVLSWSDDQWKENLKNSSLKRIKPWMWRRNANSIKTTKSE